MRYRPMQAGLIVAASALVATAPALGQPSPGEPPAPSSPSSSPPDAVPAPAPSAPPDAAPAPPAPPQVPAPAASAPADRPAPPARSTAPPAAPESVSGSSAPPGARLIGHEDTVAPPSPNGFSVGLRGGYELPLGLASSLALNDVVSGAVPLILDAGYFVNPHLYVGGYLLYGFAFNASSSPTCPAAETCNGGLLRFGAQARWHFSPERVVDPWAGAGLGYDILNLTQTDPDGNTVSLGSLHGFVLSFIGGIDYKPLPYLGIGPYSELTVGHYASTVSSAIHGWLGVGLRARTAF